MKKMKRDVSKDSMSRRSKIVLQLIVLVWLSLLVIDIFGNLFRERLTSLFYFRAWEKVTNYDGANSGYAYFKPWIIYNGRLDGDLLNLAFLKSRRKVNKKQLFIVDEYGYRNAPHFLDKPIDAVVTGTSYVGGAALDQSQLISSILTNKYGIRTYNYTNSFQLFWEDEKFKKNPPKFLIYLGEDSDIISVNWWYTIVDRVPLLHSVAWKSYQDWENETSKEKVFTYAAFAEDLRNFSLVRVGVNNLYKEILNFHRGWKAVVENSIQDMVEYDPGSDMLFFQPQYGIPILGLPGKSIQDIQKAIVVLNETDKKLQTRNIKVVIAAMPSKTYAEMKKYRNIPDSKSALAVYNSLAREKGNYINIDLLKPLQENFSNPNFHVYFPDDSHWNSTANEIAAKAIALKICPSLPITNICHNVLHETE